MRGGTSSALISGYSTFLRLRSEGRCCWRGRSEVFGIWHARVERDARHEMMRRREEKRRSAVGGSDGKNAFPPTHRARRPSVRGPYRTPAFRKSPRAAGRGRVRPRFQVSGFWGSIRRRRTFLGLVLVWPLVALGLTCVAARTTRRTGAPIMTAMFLCVEWRKRGAARSEATTDADRGNRHRKRRKETRRRGSLFGRVGGVPSRHFLPDERISKPMKKIEDCSPYIGSEYSATTNQIPAFCSAREIFVLVFED